MTLRAFLLATSVTAALAASSLPAMADDASVNRRLDQMQKMIEAQQKQIEAQKREIGGLNRALGRPGNIKDQVETPEPVAAPAAPPPPAPAIETRLQNQDQKIDDLVAKFAAAKDEQRLAVQEQPKAGITNGRLSVTSADGRFSAALRLTGQYDVGDYIQGARARTLTPAEGADLSSGSNFRRAQIGLQGKVFGDWSYYFNMDFGSGGSTGTELPGHIQQAYIEYDGLAPFAIRIGAHPPSVGLDDSYAAPDSIFLERSGPGDAMRNMAGGDGRDSLELLYAGDRLFGSLAYTGDKVQETTPVFDEQQAVVGRLAYTPYTDADWRWVVSASGTDVFRAPDTNALANSPRAFRISNPPELNVDDNSTKFADTGTVANVSDAWGWNMESAVAYDSLLVQAGYYKYGIDQRGVAAMPGLDFDGWYGEAAYVLTGEARGWSAASGAFTSPRPRVNFSSDGGWGAWEIAARYSDLDLNDNEGVAGSATPAGGIRGGEQHIATLGLNWYPNPVLKFALQLQNTQISKIGTDLAGATNANIGQNFDTVAFRSQIAF